jgi:hypothetical protein
MAHSHRLAQRVWSSLGLLNRAEFCFTWRFIADFEEIIPVKEQDAVRKFMDQIRWLYEPEFGDFKRKVGLYIQRLEESEPSLKAGAAQKIIANMKTVVVFNPNGDMESTRRQVMQLANELLSGASAGAIH